MYRLATGLPLCSELSCRQKTTYKHAQWYSESFCTRSTCWHTPSLTATSGSAEACMWTLQQLVSHRHTAHQSSQLLQWQALRIARTLPRYRLMHGLEATPTDQFLVRRYSLRFHIRSRLGQQDGHQNTTLTSLFYKNIYRKVTYVYSYESNFSDKSIYMIFTFSNSMT
jgi:hypothetical protein